ncbi:MAG: hypothetical protein C0424_02140 [Sphingobacteriaceae bacterium]|nr:hypothetical protein [Sphingobacteriaceae bacterium]
MQGITLMGQYLSAEDFIQGRAVAWMQAHQLPAPVQAFLQHWFTTDAPVLAQTSGSTGPPKTISLQRAQMIASAQLTALHFGFKAKQRALLPLSADFIAGKMMLVRAIVSGLDLYAAAPTQNTAALFPSLTFHFTPLVPAQLHALLKQEADVARLGTLLLGGSDVSPELLALMHRLEQQEVWQGFGMTETVSHIALRRLHPQAETAYLTLPGLLTEADAENQLRIWGAVTNYHWLKTNDVVIFDGPGRFRWLGRSDHVIVSAGHKVHPEYLEQKITGLMTAQDRFVPLLACPYYITSVADGQYGNLPVLVIESSQGKNEALWNHFLQAIKPQLPAWEFPRKCIWVESLERTSNGKIKRMQIEP